LIVALPSSAASRRKFDFARAALLSRPPKVLRARDKAASAVEKHGRFAGQQPGAQEEDKPGQRPGSTEHQARGT